MLALDVEKRLGDFSLAAAFETTGGATALFGASGSGFGAGSGTASGRTSQRGRSRLGWGRRWGDS